LGLVIGVAFVAKFWMELKKMLTGKILQLPKPFGVFFINFI